MDKQTPDQKLVLIVRDDLNMSKGKIASQVPRLKLILFCSKVLFISVT